jgi:hypothetical protein
VPRRGLGSKPGEKKQSQNQQKRRNSRKNFHGRSLRHYQEYCVLFIFVQGRRSLVVAST